MCSVAKVSSHCSSGSAGQIELAGARVMLPPKNDRARSTAPGRSPNRRGAYVQQPHGDRRGSRAAFAERPRHPRRDRARLGDGVPRRHGRERRLADARPRARRVALGAAVGRRRVSLDALRLHPPRGIARRRPRPLASLPRRHPRLRGDVRALRRRRHARHALLGARAGPGATLGAASWGGFVSALIEGPPHAWPRPAWLGGVLGVVALVAFVAWERHAARPMLPLALFGRRQFSAANLTTLLMYFGLSGAMFLVVLGLQQGLGYGPLGSSLILLPLAAIMPVLSPLAGKLAARIGYRVPMTIGPLCSAAGLAIAAQAGLFARNLIWLLAGMCLFAVGLSLTVAPLTSAVMSAADERDAGIASAVNNAVARVAGLLGIAVLPAVGGVSTAMTGAPFLGAIRGSLLATALFCAAGGIVSWFGLPSRALRFRLDDVLAGVLVQLRQHHFARRRARRLHRGRRRRRGAMDLAWVRLARRIRPGGDRVTDGRDRRHLHGERDGPSTARRRRPGRGEPGERRDRLAGARVRRPDPGVGNRPFLAVRGFPLLLSGRLRDRGRPAARRRRGLVRTPHRRRSDRDRHQPARPVRRVPHRGRAPRLRGSRRRRVGPLPQPHEHALLLPGGPAPGLRGLGRAHVRAERARLRADRAAAPRRGRRHPRRRARPDDHRGRGVQRARDRAALDLGVPRGAALVLHPAPHPAAGGVAPTTPATLRRRLVGDARRHRPGRRHVARAYHARARGLAVPGCDRLHHLLRDRRNARRPGAHAAAARPPPRARPRART